MFSQNLSHRFKDDTVWGAMHICFPDGGMNGASLDRMNCATMMFFDALPPLFSVALSFLLQQGELGLLAQCLIPLLLA
jgi:hypothetical protein